MSASVFVLYGPAGDVEGVFPSLEMAKARVLEKVAPHYRIDEWELSGARIAAYTWRKREALAFREEWRRRGTP